MIDGLLLEVRADERSTAATAAAAVGATVVPVEDVTPFGDNGGRVDIAGVVYDYAGVDTSTVTADGDGGALLLVTPLTAAVEEFDPLSVLVGTDVAVDFYAVVDLGEDDEAGHHIEVPLDTREERLAWPVRVYDPPLPVSLSDDLQSIVHAHGAMPQMDGALMVAPMLTAARGSDLLLTDNTWTTLNGWFVLKEDRINADPAFGHMLIVEVDGWYDLRAGVTFALSSTGNRAIRPHLFGVDGTDIGPMRQVKIPADGQTTIETAQYAQLYAGQGITFEAWQNSGASLNVRGSNVFTSPPLTDCSIRWVGPL